MSKIKVDTVESSQNVKISPNGTGLVEVKGAGGADGTLQLSAGTNTKIKIKSPPHSAGQSYTMILPDNNIEAGKFLKVKSVSGTTGQLEYASIAVPDVNNLNANNLTSGTVPSARFPSSFSANDAAFELVQKVELTSDVANIEQSLDNNSMYWIIGKKYHSEYASSYETLWTQLYTSGGSSMNLNSTRRRVYPGGGSNETNSYGSVGSYLATNFSVSNMQRNAFQIYIANHNIPWMLHRAFKPGVSQTLFESYTYATSSGPAAKVRFSLEYKDTLTGSQILFYKFKRS